MNTLYDVLGISRQTNAAQIELGYRTILETLAGNANNVEQDMIRAKAIKEAYAILSSPSRRAAYDEKLRLKEQVSYEVVEKHGMPWISLVLMGLMLAGAFGYYRLQAQKVEVERIALETARANIAAREAAKLAEAEESRLAQLVLLERSRAETNRQRESDQARSDGQYIHQELQSADAQASREKEDRARSAHAARRQEEQAAQYRSRNQLIEIQRALAIPVRRQ